MSKTEPKKAKARRSNIVKAKNIINNNIPKKERSEYRKAVFGREK